MFEGFTHQHSLASGVLDLQVLPFLVDFELLLEVETFREDIAAEIGNNTCNCLVGVSHAVCVGLELEISYLAAVDDGWFAIVAPNLDLDIGSSNVGAVTFILNYDARAAAINQHKETILFTPRQGSGHGDSVEVIMSHISELELC